jgi:cytochrome oxidase Cu insertion factor (SCO1/SenC/PrrC family)
VNFRQSFSRRHNGGACDHRKYEIAIAISWRRVFMNRLITTVLVVGMFFPTLRAADKPAETPPPAVKVGDMAPDFTLSDQNGNKVSLHDFKGKKNVALAFYIFAFTGG